MELRLLYTFVLLRQCHKQLISNGGRFRPAFAKRNKKQAMIDLCGISRNWFKKSHYRAFKIAGSGSIDEFIKNQLS